MTAAPARPQDPSEATRLSYWSVVGAQLRKNRVAMFSAWLAAALIATAVGAPLLAMNRPYVASEGGRLSSPLAASLFDRFVFPNGVDVFFNLLLVLGPIWWTASRLGVALRRRRADAPGARVWLWGPAFVGVVGVFLWAAQAGAADVGRLTWAFGLPGALAIGVAQARAGTRRVSPLRWTRLVLLLLLVTAFGLLLGPWRGSQALVDWTAKADAMEAAGTGWAAFPPCRFHPDNVGELGPGPASRSLRRPGGPHVMGCDLNGRDVLARLVFGTRISMTIGLVAVAIFIFIGAVLGSLAGFYGGWVDLAVMRFVEVMMCFPSLFLILTMVAVFESRSIFLIMAVIGLVGWPGVARLVRGEFLRQRNLDYVVAAHALGVPERRVIFGHVFPNCIGPVLVSATFGIASSIITESGLAFLGLGDSTSVSWGQMLNSGRSEGQWHLILVPGAAIFVVVLVFNLLGEGLRDALDPKLRR